MKFTNAILLTLVTLASILGHAGELRTIYKSAQRGTCGQATAIGFGASNTVIFEITRSDGYSVNRKEIVIQQEGNGSVGRTLPKDQLDRVTASFTAAIARAGSACFTIVGKEFSPWNQASPEDAFLITFPTEKL